MRFLGIGDSCDLGALYLRLLAEGHEVKVHVGNPLCHDTLAGLVERTDDWKRELGWVREPGENGIILFENVAEKRGVLQDELRRDGFNVVGGSAFGDRLENDRGYAQDVLRDLGLSICAVKTFQNRSEAIDYLRRKPGRYVVKFNEAYETFVGQLPRGEVRGHGPPLTARTDDPDPVQHAHSAHSRQSGTQWTGRHRQSESSRRPRLPLGQRQRHQLLSAGERPVLSDQ